LSRGEIVGLVGKNGSGKTTLISAMLGLAALDSGCLFVDGARLRRKLGLFSYLPQDSFLPERLPIRRAVFLMLEKNERNTAFGFLDDFGINVSARPSGISHGQRRIAELCLVLSMERPFVLLDEPFLRIDPKHAFTVTRLIRSRAKHRGILIADHDYRSLLELCTKMILVKDGNTAETHGMDGLRNSGYIPDTDERRHAHDE
jgi:ABC-type multidrug transport system ATPase subunit